MATLAAFRWPTWFVPDEFNPDESQIIAGAITLKKYLLHWKYVDAGTHGPIAEYLLVMASWFGAPLNHATARAMGTLLQAVSLIATWRTLTNFTSQSAARCAILPGLTFWAAITWHDFLHYGTELPGITLIALAAWALAAPLASQSAQTFRSNFRLFLGGFLLGLVPVTKPQIIPLGLVVGLGAMITLLWRGRKTVGAFGARWLAPISLVCGAIFPLIILLGYLLIFGLVDQFWWAYVFSAVAYSGDGHHPFAEMPSWFFHFSATAFGFAWFFWGIVAFALLFTRGAPTRMQRLVICLGWGSFAIAMFCVLRPSREVAHYLHILVIPLVFLAGIILQTCTHKVETKGPLLFWPWAAFFLITIFPQIHFRTLSPPPFIGAFAAHVNRPLSPAANYIEQHRGTDDTLAMWGWEPRLFVELGMPQGTRETNSTYQLMGWPLRDFYINRYKNDLEKRKPTWFVDAVGPGMFVYEDRNAYAHETIPVIHKIISNDYALVTELDSKRIYRLKSHETDRP